MEPTNTETPETVSPTPAPASSPWTKRIIIGGVALVALSGVGLATAMGNDFGRGMHHFASFSGGHGMGGYGERRLDRVLEEIDATPEQSEKIKAIIDAAQDQIFPMADEFRGTREDVAKLLGAPTIDRAAAETLRAQRVAKMDEASKKVTTAILDAAEVLTPEQRAELVEHFEDRGWRGRW